MGGLFLVLQLTLVGWVVGTVVAGRNLKRQRRRRRSSGVRPRRTWVALLQ